MLLCLKHHRLAQSHKGRALEINSADFQIWKQNPSLALLFNCHLLMLTYSRKLMMQLLEITANCKSVTLT